MSESQAAFKSGLTWRSSLGIIASAVIFIPVSIYASLLIGSGIGGSAVFATTLLVVELARMFRQPLTKQETLVLYYGAGVGGTTWGGTLVSAILYRTYLIHSPFATAYKIDGIPLEKYIPSWMAPPLGSPAYLIRSFLQPAFAPSIAYYATMAALGFVGEISLDMMVARALVEVENYPFPYANVDVSFTTFLSDRPKSYMKPFIGAMALGVVFGLVAYLIPGITGYYLLPLPYADLTWLIQGMLPGAVLAFTTPLSSYIAGFIFPFDAALIMFGTAVVLDVFQSLFITKWPNVFPKWSSSYFRGMGLIAINTRSFGTLWFGPQVGFMIGGAIMALILARKGVASLFRNLFRVGRRSILGFPSMATLFVLYLAATLTSVAVFHYLVPTVPLYVPLAMSVGFSFLLGVIIASVQGTVGFTPSISAGTLWNGAVYLTPYQGYAGFMAPPILVGTNAGTFGQMIRASLVTETKPIDMVKLSILTAILSSVIGLFTINYFWSVAPIPSSVYPATIFSYPAMAQSDALIVTRQLTISPEIVLASMGIVMVVIAVGELLHKYAAVAWSTFGFLFGLYAGFPAAASLFIGSAIGYFLMPRFFGGRSNWNNYKGAVVAGELFGEGMILMLATVLGMLGKSGWLWPW
ncbi:hypothetical protein PQ610_00765 [Tardisphaera miroshnichenkoae]